MFTRTPPPARASGDRRRGLIYIFAGLAVVYLVLTALGTLWTDLLWFDSVGYAGIWRRRWLVGIGLAVVGTLVTFITIWTTLLLADRLGPRYFPVDTTEEEELVVRFRQWVEGRVGRVRFLVAAVFSLFVGVGVASWRDEVFLFLNRQDFDRVDPIFGLEVGFYVFQFPLIDTALSWIFNLVAAAVVMATVAHYLNGGIRVQRGSLPTFTRGAKVHISILLAILALIRAAMYRLDALALLYSNRQPNFFGPGFTDHTARLPALRLLMAIAVLTAIVLLVNLARRGWTLVMVAVAAWVLVSIAALLIYPAVVERLQVQPEPLARESEYIAHSIEFTRAAYSLDDVEVREFPASSNLTGDDIEANRPTIDNLRLWDTSVLPRTYQNLQVIRPYYGLQQVDTDRYELADGLTQTMVAVRELDEGNIPRTDWQNTRLAYTHGIGAVVSPANAVESDGQPDFLLADLPPVASEPALELTEPRVYFGESYQPGRPVIVRTGSGPQEVDMPVGGERIQPNQYEGTAGVELSSLWRRIAFAFRYRDLNLLISGQVRSDSRVLVQRNIEAIVGDIAPFLEVDSDPYPVISEGRIVWVIDLYTSSGFYPYSQPITQAARSRLPRSTDLENGLNYVASSVKATIDAYNGTVDFYMVDESDPLIRAWRRVYPGLFQDGAEMPEDLKDHLRYPQDMFRVQGELYLEYHVDAAAEFFNGNDVWSIPPDPSTPLRGAVPGSELLIGDRGDAATPTAYLSEILPYYLLTRLPGEQQMSYVLLQPFNPRDKPNMSSFMAADAPTESEPGRLVDFRMPQGILVGGTGQIGDRIQQDDEIAEQFTLWRGQGSAVIQGDLLAVPVEESVLYIQPIYLQAEGSGFPEFRRVVVVFGNEIEWASSLDVALAQVFDIELSPDDIPPEEPSEPGGEVPTTVQELIAEAASLIEQANEALAAGNLGEYQRLVDEAGALIRQAEALVEPDVGASLP